MTDITPSNIPTTSFSEKIDLYEKTLDLKLQQEATIAKVEFEIRDLFNQSGIGIRFKDENQWLGLDDKLTIYKPFEEKGKKDTDVIYAAATEGTAFSNLAGNPVLLKMLTKRFGAEMTAFILAVDDFRQMKGQEEKQIVDEVSTEKLKARYAKLSRALITTQSELKTTEAKLHNIEKSIDFVKSILALSAGKGQPQKGQQGDQGLREKN